MIDFLGHVSGEYCVNQALPHRLVRLGVQVLKCAMCMVYQALLSL